MGVKVSKVQFKLSLQHETLRSNVILGLCYYQEDKLNIFCVPSERLVQRRQFEMNPGSSSKSEIYQSARRGFLAQDFELKAFSSL